MNSTFEFNRRDENQEQEIEEWDWCEDQAKRESEEDHDSFYIRSSSVEITKEQEKE